MVTCAEAGPGRVVTRYVVGGAGKVENVARFMCYFTLKPFSISVKSMVVDVVESSWGWKSPRRSLNGEGGGANSARNQTKGHNFTKIIVCEFSNI